MMSSWTLNWNGDIPAGPPRSSGRNFTKKSRLRLPETHAALLPHVTVYGLRDRRNERVRNKNDIEDVWVVKQSRAFEAPMSVARCMRTK